MNISRLTTLVLISILLVPFNASAHCNGKHSGDHPHCADSGGDGGSGEYTYSEGVVRTPSGDSNFDYEIVGTPARDTINAGGGRDLIRGGADEDDIQALGADDQIHGEGGNDSIDGGEGDDVVYGDAGSDFLNGGPGTDWLYGGVGDDYLFFSLGSPTALPGQYEAEYYDGGPGDDELHFARDDHDFVNGVTVDLTLGTYEATVRLSSGTLVTANGTLSNIEGSWAPTGDNILLGIDEVLLGVDATRTTFQSQEGDDLIQTFGGDDQIGGGGGNDLIYAGAGNDNISAGDGTDIVYAGTGDDIVSGLSYEGTSVDYFYGEEGCDTFVFNRAFGTATIMDYNYPYNGEFSCDLIHFRYEPYWRADSGDAVISTVGNDIVVDIWIKRGGGVGGTVILKDAILHGVTLEMSDISFEDE